MGFSPLISGTILTQNCYAPRSYAITRITPHYMAWYTSAKVCCESFMPAARKASANYCIGKDGEIFLNVDEDNAAWTSGNYDNDNRAVTIECANYMETSYGHIEGQLPTPTWDSLVRLVADIAKRHGFKRVAYTGTVYNNDKSAILLTKHKWFQSTDCPGPWLDYQFDRLAQKASELMGAKPENNTSGGKLVVDGYGGYNTILDMQHWLKTPEDGFMSGQYRPNYDYFWGFTDTWIDWTVKGSPMVKALQHEIGAESDGIWGKETSTKLQMMLIGAGFDCGSSQADGYFGSDSVKALQSFLNDKL